MRKLMVIAWMSLLISSVAVASEKTNSLILLTAESEAETEEAIEMIQYFGGEVRHVFVPDVLIGYLPPEVENRLIGRSFVSKVLREEFSPETYIPESKTNKLAIAAWNNLLIDKKPAEVDLSRIPRLRDHALPPLNELKGEEALSPQEPLL